jgi:hypothetical protein
MHLTTLARTAAILCTLACTALPMLGASQSTPPGDVPKQDPKIPASAFVTEAPKDAKDVAALKKSAKKGDTVVLRAKVGGRSEPFVKNRAIFMVADRSIRSCDEIPGDTCTRPWDYCCESPESKKANLATVQFTGADGKALKVGAQSVGGLEPLKLVVIEGVVSEIDDKGTFVIDARKVFVEPPVKK